MRSSLSRSRFLPRAVLLSLFVLLPFFAAITSCAENEANKLEPVHKGSKVLTNGELIVEVMIPSVITRAFALRHWLPSCVLIWTGMNTFIIQ